MILQWLIFAIIIIGAVGIAFVVARAAGVEIPAWIISVGWIVLAVCIGVVAIKFLASML